MGAVNRRDDHANQSSSIGGDPGGRRVARCSPRRLAGSAKRSAKRAAKEATESAAKQAAEDAAKKAVKKAAAPDAIDLNAAPPEQLAKLGLDEATTKKIVDARPFSSMDDPKIKEAIPADVLAKLEGKVTVKPPAKTEGGPAPASPPQ